MFIYFLNLAWLKCAFCIIIANVFITKAVDIKLVNIYILY